jgi:hypothetical protein
MKDTLENVTLRRPVMRVAYQLNEYVKPFGDEG